MDSIKYDGNIIRPDDDLIFRFKSIDYKDGQYQKATVKSIKDISTESVTAYEVEFYDKVYLGNDFSFVRRVALNDIEDITVVHNTGVFIPGMSLPIDCADCPCECNEYGECELIELLTGRRGVETASKGRLPECPLVETVRRQNRMSTIVSIMNGVDK